MFFYTVDFCCCESTIQQISPQSSWKEDQAIKREGKHLSNPTCLWMWNFSGTSFQNWNRRNKYHYRNTVAYCKSVRRSNKRFGWFLIVALHLPINYLLCSPTVNDLQMLHICQSKWNVNRKREVYYSHNKLIMWLLMAYVAHFKSGVKCNISNFKKH